MATESDTSESREVLEELETVESKIADQLSELSDVDELPTGYKLTDSPFAREEVNFRSSSWLLRVLQVQAWLNPDTEIRSKSAMEQPFEAAKALFRAIGATSPDICISEDPGYVRLTLAGAEHLAARLDTASQLQQQFLELLETLNRKQATESWREAWEENEVDAASTEPIKAKSDTWRISDFSGKSSRGALNLNPSYQRGDVWPTRDSQKLIESILRGIPLPSIILLRPERGGKYEVVDGKQRLTAILRFIGQHPTALAIVKEYDKKYPKADLEDLFTSNYKKFRRVWKSQVGESLSDRKEAEYYFPFRLARNSDALSGPLAVTAGKYYHEILDTEIHVGEGQETVREVFEKSSEYKIPLIEYLDATPRQIHEVFHLYNRQGKHLNAEEIRNALFHDVDLVRLLLVASGDNKSIAELARYIPQEKRNQLKAIATYLDDYRFGSARYRKTKMLSWLCALLFQPSIGDGELTVRSTAKQIDALFEQIRGGHRLSDRTLLVELIGDIERCLDSHSAADCWEPRFKDDDRGAKWQELQLVASLLAVFLIGSVQSSPGDVLQQHRDELLAFTKDHPRPEKTQNKTQWAYIGQVALGIATTVGIKYAEISDALMSRYGSDCIPTLNAARALFRPRVEE